MTRTMIAKTGPIEAHDFKHDVPVLGLPDRVPAAKRGWASHHKRTPAGPTRRGRPPAHGMPWPARRAFPPRSAPGSTGGWDPEAERLCAAVDAMAPTEAHATASTMQRSMCGTAGKARNVAVLKAAHRAKEATPTWPRAARVRRWG